MTLLFTLLACGPAISSATAASPAAPPPAQKTAVANLEPRSGSKTTGTVKMVESGDKVKVTIDLKGATPGEHAVHIHEKGDCSAPDGMSAGGHFNPGGTMQHGGPDMPMHHPGDFGNVTVGPDGTGHKELETSSFKLAGTGVVVSGLAVIVHEKPDDFSQPSGNAGARQACGIIALQ